MKVLVAYSSITGNTEKIGKSIAEALPNSECVKLPTEKKAEDYDLVFCGFWCDKGVPDNDWKQFYESTGTVPVAVFGTLGGDPHNEGGMRFLQKVKNEIHKPSLLDLRLWQGKVDPKIIEIMTRMSGKPMTEERRLRLEEANKHPDSKDLREAAQWAFEIFKSQQA